MATPRDGDPAGVTGSSRRWWVGRATTAFGRFWWDFLVGDTPELFVAVVLLVGVVAAVAKTVSTTAAWVLIPFGVIAALAGSVRRGRRP